MNDKKWNWQQDDWPDFRYDKTAIEALETDYIKASGISFGIMKSLSEEDRAEFSVELICDEALKTSEIEGDILNRDSLRSSIMREFGLTEKIRPIGTTPEEEGIAKMMRALYSDFGSPLTHEMLFNWHDNLMRGRWKVKAGEYRTHDDEMKVISGRVDKPVVHFVAPPSKEVLQEMDRFIAWFNSTSPEGGTPLPPVARSGIAHLHFVSIHPFEDGNGRIGRALVTKILSQSLGAPVISTVSSTINADRDAYYKSLEVQSRGNEITPYLVSFGRTILESQELTVRKLDFLITKANFFKTFEGRINPRQEKVILRIFKEGLKGFEGGLSVKNYISITKAPRTTATRDLKDLVDKGAFTRSGKLKATRYSLNLDPFTKASFFGRAPA